ncbi:WSCD family member AAEL009094 [Uranotaenia lowii]|uniref:WSCD family member AAEL009094 n=1 Tax=Uranotaenia lowii TaxID=190385 RepID=UPI002478E648|nr:WSCD family member AAEL009094 [Uranotaenia lowii]XP_055606933.1 WSCD family member AAEL009094 [Uranotaenia lowii]XP_055606934.1 WSCD family member AAEL009094 [Uranotaenia lowii]
MALRGWRLIGLAGTILVYIGGILFLSFVSLQNPQQKRSQGGRGGGYGEFETLRNRDLGLLGKKPPLQWCTELRYMDSRPPPPKAYKLLQTFPGHFVKKIATYNFKVDAEPAPAAPPPPENAFREQDDHDAGSSRNSHRKRLIATELQFSDRGAAQWPNSDSIKFTDNSKLADSDRIINDQKPPPPGAMHKSSKHGGAAGGAAGGLTALVSFPGSGNTWLRYLLQQSTGIYTGSVYKDYGLLKSGFPAENIANSSVLVIKTHEWGPNAWAPYSKAILLIRDPEKAILAEFNRQSGGHVGFASPDRYRRTKGRYWTQFVKNKLWAWEQTNLSWAKNFTGEVKLIFYDDLVENVEATLRSILKFLRFPIDEELLACALSRKEGIYRRKKRILQFDPYSPAMRVTIDEKRAEVYAALGRFDAH